MKGKPHKTNPPYPPLTGGQEKAKPPLPGRGHCLGGGASPFYTPLSRGGVGGVAFPFESDFSSTPEKGSFSTPPSRSGLTTTVIPGYADKTKTGTTPPLRGLLKEPREEKFVCRGRIYATLNFFCPLQGPHICGPYNRSGNDAGMTVARTLVCPTISFSLKPHTLCAPQNTSGKMTATLCSSNKEAPPWRFATPPPRDANTSATGHRFPRARRWSRPVITTRARRACGSWRRAETR